MTGRLLHSGAAAESVIVKHEGADRYVAWYAGRWRRVHIQFSRCYIVYDYRRISIFIDGV